MNNNIIPEDLVSKIFEYLPYNKQRFITKNNYNKINLLYKQNINKIQKFYKKSISRIRITQEYTNYQSLLFNLNKKDIQTYYILYYPEEYKEDFMKLTFQKIIPINCNRLTIIYHDNNLSLNRKFMNFVRLLQINELSHIGW